MPEVQDELSKGLIAIVFKSFQFSKDFAKAVGDFLESDKQKHSRGGGAADKEVKHGKMKTKDFIEKEGQKESIKVNDIKDWDKVAKHFGVDYAVERREVLDEKGKPVMDYSDCEFEYETDGKTPKFDYSECKIKKDKLGLDMKDEKTGLPILEPGSPDPKPVLADKSPQPKKQYEYTVFFKAQDTSVINLAFEDFVKKNEKKQQRSEQKYEKKHGHKRVNIKEMIQEFKAKAEEQNKDNPEKHHNRGEQSL